LPVIEEEEVIEKGSQNSIHCDREEEFVGVLLSPRDKGSVIKATQTPMIRILPPLPTEPAKIHCDYWRIFMEPKTSTIEFLIVDIGTSALMKPIPLTTLASFHGLTSEDTNKFLIE